jgi:hypothetical protein
VKKSAKIQVPRIRPRAHKALFDAELPFQPRRERDQTLYRRRPKHPKRLDGDS